MRRIQHILVLLFIMVTTVYGQDILLAGTADGLYRVTGTQRIRIWERNDIQKILRTQSEWLFLTGNGITASGDLVTFEDRNSGLPVKVVKIPEPSGKSFRREVQGLKDLEVHPANQHIMVTATKDAVYLSRDAGKSWKSLGLSARTSGVKAVSVLDLPDANGTMQLTVLMSHPIYGISWQQPDTARATWNDMNAGLEHVPDIRWPDEVADIHTVKTPSSTQTYVSQTFMGRIYRLDWQGKRFIPLWKNDAALDTIDGLWVSGGRLVYSSPSALRELLLSDDGTTTRGLIPADITGIAASAGSGLLQCAWIPASRTGGRGALALSELWLLSPAVQSARWAQTAQLKKGNYIPVHQVTTDAGLAGHLKTLTDKNLNMLVIDMKDDYGFLRYDSKDPLVQKMGKTGKGINLDTFVPAAKAKGIYLVARIVVFKDRELSRHNGGAYAVWDKREKKSWQGYELVNQKIEATATEDEKTEQVRKYYEEYWVDPYSEDVWRYNVAISKELIGRGFDEIQFDYIRFPTDGKNLEDASYRWQDEGMDKESALMSFLSYARKEIQAPISIDIYGANGWYRTGARTGQDVELLARYVDVICPMFYPSHFEQSFLAQKPAAERPYRIYYYGSYRNAIIARNHVLVRPWAQAFYLNVSYDRTYYNQDYVQRQIFGVRDSLNQGYTYWNNSGRYGDLRADIGLDDQYPWDLPAGASELARPFFGNTKK